MTRRQFVTSAAALPAYVPAVSLGRGQAAREGAIDAAVAEVMRKFEIPGLSLAIVQSGRIVVAKGYGLRAAGGRAPVEADTLFQAGSVSKPVAAMAALALVERGKLALDEDVNRFLKSWNLPQSDLTREHKVTLRGLLSHTAGMTVHGFPGYDRTGAIPTLVQVLDGKPPANTPPIRVETQPGSKWNYSGGGYTVMQQMMVDATGKPFAEFLRETVIDPLGMTHSGYFQPLPAARAEKAATGHYDKNKPVPHDWHVYPEMAAAGLWTTATDLAHFLITVARMANGQAATVLKQPTAQLMVTPVMQGDALGLFVQGEGRARRFSHSGRNEGFDTLLLGYLADCSGATIMINKNVDNQAMAGVVNAIAKAYDWPQ